MLSEFLRLQKCVIFVPRCPKLMGRMVFNSHNEYYKNTNLTKISFEYLRSFVMYAYMYFTRTKNLYVCQSSRILMQSLIKLHGHGTVQKAGDRFERGMKELWHLILPTFIITWAIYRSHMGVGRSKNSSKLKFVMHSPHHKLQI